MVVLILQSALLLAVAFILGCIIGCLLKTLFSGDSAGSGAPAAAASAATATAATAAVSAASTPKAVEPANAPEPVALASPEPKAAEKPAVKKPAAKKASLPKKASAAKKASAPEETTASTKATSKKSAKPKAQKTTPSGPPPAGSKADNLKLIKGIGPQNEARLQAFGVTRFSNIAEWTAEDATEWGERLAFPGRIEREDWIGQAKVLAQGGSTDFASRVKSGDVASSVGEATVGDLGKKPRLLSKPRASGADNLTLIDGVGNALEKRLFAIGIYHFDQIAKLTPEQAKWVGIAVGFPGRVEREKWVEECKILAEGGMTEHAKRVEEGKVATSRVSKDDET